jgi:hypothetical protein
VGGFGGGRGGFGNGLCGCGGCRFRLGSAHNVDTPAGSRTAAQAPTKRAVYGAIPQCSKALIGKGTARVNVFCALHNIVTGVKFCPGFGRSAANRRPIHSRSLSSLLGKVHNLLALLKIPVIGVDFRSTRHGLPD